MEASHNVRKSEGTFIFRFDEKSTKKEKIPQFEIPTLQSNSSLEQKIEIIDTSLIQACSIAELLMQHTTEIKERALYLDNETSENLKMASYGKAARAFVKALYGEGEEKEFHTLRQSFLDCLFNIALEHVKGFKEALKSSKENLTSILEQIKESDPAKGESLAIVIEVVNNNKMSEGLISISEKELVSWEPHNKLLTETLLLAYNNLLGKASNYNFDIDSLLPDLQSFTEAYFEVQNLEIEHFARQLMESEKRYHSDFGSHRFSPSGISENDFNELADFELVINDDSPAEVEDISSISIHDLEKDPLFSKLQELAKELKPLKLNKDKTSPNFTEKTPEQEILEFFKNIFLGKNEEEIKTHQKRQEFLNVFYEIARKYLAKAIDLDAFNLNYEKFAQSQTMAPHLPSPVKFFYSLIKKSPFPELCLTLMEIGFNNDQYDLTIFNDFLSELLNKNPDMEKIAGCALRLARSLIEILEKGTTVFDQM